MSSRKVRVKVRNLNLGHLKEMIGDYSTDKIVTLKLEEEN